ncbi:MAG: sce7726 family protein [Candidatus Muirbacterium halophilum]|nr:sce7726 family protein [Candidatus Muirbacterium halophilum]MCK9477437.1 sce7726 family protein [Candidatus Muirbacterium halophilum]
MKKKDLLLLNKLFTKNFFKNILIDKSQNEFYQIAKKFVDISKRANNLVILKEIYKIMSKSYRNEYFYQNTLFLKLLLGKHSLNTTIALKQVPIEKSIADFILINGKAIVYEIKTELDNFNRLQDQLDDYYKGFVNVCVVTNVKNFDKLLLKLENTPTGIMVLTDRNTLSRKKASIDDYSCLNYESIFKILRKNEVDRILLKHFKELPKVTQVFYYSECLKMFKRIPISKAYELAILELKKRVTVNIEEFKKIPSELKSIAYFSKYSLKEYRKFNEFLGEENVFSVS